MQTPALGCLTCTATCAAVPDLHAWCRVITIHNNPDNMTLPGAYAHLRIEMPDIDTANITAYFDPTFNFIEEGRVKGHGASAALPNDVASTGNVTTRLAACQHDCACWQPHARPLIQCRLVRSHAGALWGRSQPQRLPVHGLPDAQQAHERPGGPGPLPGAQGPGGPQ